MCWCMDEITQSDSHIRQHGSTSKTVADAIGNQLATDISTTVVGDAL